MRVRDRLRPLWRAAVHFHEDSCLSHSAAVAFYSLLSIGPFLYLASASLGAVLGDDSASEAILSSIASFLPSEAHAGLTSLKVELSGGQPLLLVAVPTLMWVAAGAFIEFELALNVAFARRNVGGRWIPRLKGYALFGAGSLLLVGGLVFSTLLPRLARLRTTVGLSDPSDGWTATLSWLSVLALTYAMFLLFYRVLSRGAVAWGAAARGALLALVLWEIARTMFGTAVESSYAFGLLRGALAGMVAFMMWMYVSVAVVLMGAELAAVLNGNRD